jgi:hypothetical protein
LTGWTLGSYGDLHKAVGADEQGNYVGKGHVEMEDVENCYIENHEDKPVAVVGLDNVVVIFRRLFHSLLDIFYFADAKLHAEAKASCLVTFSYSRQSNQKDRSGLVYLE